MYYLNHYSVLFNPYFDHLCEQNILVFDILKEEYIQLTSAGYTILKYVDLNKTSSLDEIYFYVKSVEKHNISREEFDSFIKQMEDAHILLERE